MKGANIAGFMNVAKAMIGLKGIILNSEIKTYSRI